MSDKSTIEWTEATWNPVTGCSKVSPGCANCYAETLSLRYGYSKLPWTPANAEQNVVLHPERLHQPLKWRRPRLIFVNSMSDLFHELVPFEYVDRVFEVMEHAPQHTFQVLTKRPERQRDYMSYRVKKAAMGDQDLGPPFESVLPNVWLGTSIENDRWVDRADALRQTWAAVRFLSCEPLLGPLPSLELTGLDWVIVGGESGHGHRPIRAEWVRDIRDRCIAEGVAFFFKQWGGRTPKAGGRELDGRTWDDMPRRGHLGVQGQHATSQGTVEVTRANDQPVRFESGHRPRADPLPLGHPSSCMLSGRYCRTRNAYRSHGSCPAPR